MGGQENNMANEKQNRVDISTERLALMLDRMDITDVLCRYGSAIDRCSADQSDATFALLADCLSEDVVVDYGVGGMHKGLDAWIAFVRQSAPRMGRTLHLYTNFLINVDGDTAHAVFNVQATHTWESERGPRFLIAGGTFEDDLRRTANGWRISHITLNALYNNDPTGKLAELFPGAPPS
jgi:SnoaL-like domain